MPPDWPDGRQQVHLDLHVDDLQAAHQEAIALDARLLTPTSTSAAYPDEDEDFAVCADPTSHPFCLGIHNTT